MQRYSRKEEWEGGGEVPEQCFLYRHTGRWRQVQNCFRRGIICVPLLNKIDCGDVFYKTPFDAMILTVAFVEFSELAGGEQKCDEFLEWI